MKKRLLAFFLMLIMVMGSTAVCSAQSTSLKDVVGQTQNLTTGKFSYEFQIKSDAKATDMPAEYAQYAALLKNLYIKLDGTMAGTTASMSMSYKMSDSDTYKEITDMFTDGSTVYMNMKKLVAFMKATNVPELAAYAQLIPVDKTYVKITMDDIAAVSGTTVDTSSLTMSADQAAALTQGIYTILDKSVKGVKPAVVTVKDGVYKIDVNNKNAVKFLTNLKKNIDASDLADKQTFSSELKSVLADLKKDKKTKFSFVATMELKGTDGSRVLNQTMNINMDSKKDGKVAMNFNGTFTEDKTVTVTLPTTDFITFTDLYKALTTATTTAPTTTPTK
jgi:hypothetical protein